MQQTLNLKFATVACVAVFAMASTAKGQDYCPVPPPVPPPEPGCCVVPKVAATPAQEQSVQRLKQFASLKPLSSNSQTPDRHPRLAPSAQQVSAGVTQQAQRPKSKLTIIVEDVAGTDEPLPEILRYCPLHEITLQKSQSKVSLRDEELPVPENVARKYLASHGREVAPFIAGAPSLNHPEPEYHRPLYFEDPNLERCGAGCGILTEAVSAIRFFGRVPLVPYMAASQPPHTCVQSLGECQVCERFGKRAYLPAPAENALTVEALTIVGLVFLLP